MLPPINDLPGPTDPNNSAAWLAAIVESSGDAIISKDLNSIVHSWNPSAELIFGYTAAEMIGTSIMKLIPADRKDEEDMILGKIKRGEKVEHFETRRRTKDGRLIDVSVTASPVRDASGQIVGVSKIARDITPLKQREKEIARISRLYAALSQVNQAIVMMPTRNELLHKASEVLVEFGGFELASILQHDAATSRLVPVAVSGHEHDYFQSIQIHSDDRPTGRGPAGRAFRGGRPCISNDLMNDPTIAPWRSELQGRGLRSVAVFPIRCQRKVIGTLNVYASETDFFQDKEISLLDEATRDISFGLDAFVHREKQQTSEARYRALFEQAPDGIVITNDHSVYLDANSSLCRMLGYSRDELVGRSVSDVVVPAEAEQFASALDANKDRTNYQREWQFRRKDGSTFPADVITSLIPDGNIMGMIRDITEQKRAEAALRESEARFRTMANSMSQLAWIAQADGFIFWYNQRWYDYTGTTPEQMEGWGWQHVHDPAILPRVMKDWPAAIAAGMTFEMEFPLRSADGRFRRFLTRAMPLKNAAGDVVQWFGTNTDVESLKQAEAALREANLTLEHKVALRTKELSTALVRAEAADRIKSAFLATMSHELRTPLNSIIGFTGIVLQGMAGPLSAEQSKQLGMVQGSARHLLELINDVLDISKIEAGQLEVSAESFDLPTMIERVTASANLLAMKKGLTLTVKVDPSLNQMVNDPRRVEQILHNLLNNALKFTLQGGATLVAERVQASPQSQPSLRITVSDTGVGIKTKDLAKLFEPFRQIDSGLTRAHEGTGLGLSISRRLVELMGGEISVTSEWEQGSKFTVLLPLQKPLTSS